MSKKDRSSDLAKANNDLANVKKPEVLLDDKLDGGGSEGSSELGVNEAGVMLFAISRGKIKALKKCLDQGMNVNAQDYDGRSGLHVAACTGSVPFLQLLIEKGADVNIKDRWGRTPMDDAVSQGHRDAIAFLQSKNAKHGTGVGDDKMRLQGGAGAVPLDPRSGAAILLQAAAEGDVEKLKNLLDRGEATVDTHDYDRRTAAHLAASEGRLNVLQFLAEHGANFNFMDRWGNRCLNDALRAGHTECIAFLRSKGAEQSLPEDDKQPKMITLKNASPQAMAELHARGVREFWALDHDDFEIDSEPFAKGAGGEIFKARWRDLECVAKTCGKLTMTEQNLTDLGNEISLMATIRHPNIIMFFGACFQLSPPVILLEYCSGGNLETRILKAYTEGARPSDKISPFQKWKYAHELALGMTFLHKCTIPIIHRDLKPSNVLISAEDTIKITDFGLAKFVPIKNKFLEDKFTMTGETGSYRFMAPEVYRHEPYNQAVDVYSYSLICYWMFSGVRPFYNIADPVKAVKYAALEKGRPNVSVLKDAKVRAIVEQGWAENPDSRPSFSQIVKFWEENKETVVKRSESCVLS